MLDPDLGEKLQRKIEMGINEGSNILWGQQHGWFHITSIVSLPRYMVSWCLSPITSILSKLRESGSSSLPTIAQNLSAINLTVVDETKTEEAVIKSRGFLFGFFSDMLDNLISYYPVTLVIGEEKKDMFSISLVLTCAVVSCCVTLLVNFLISRRGRDLWSSNHCRKRRSEDQINYDKDQEEEDRGDFPTHRLSNLTTLNNSNIDNTHNAASSGRSRSNMTMSQSTYNNQNQFQDAFKLLRGEKTCCMTSLSAEGKMMNDASSKKPDTLETIILNQFPRGNFSPCFEMHGMALETILRLSGIPHVVNCVCEQTGPPGPSITVYDGTTNKDIWGLQSIFNFLKHNYPDQINSFLTPPEYELQAEFINIYLENRVCWLLYHWRWFYGINCKIKKFAWTNIDNSYIELAASSWNRLFGDTSIDCLVDEILKSFNVLSQLLGEKDYFVHDGICDVDIRIFAVLSQALFASPCTTLEGLIKAKPNLVNFCHRIRNITWEDWEDLCLQNSNDCGGGEGDTDKTNQSFDDISYSDNPTSNSELKFESPHHHHHDYRDEGDIPESMLPKSRTKTKKHSTIPFYCPPEIHSFHKYNDEDSRRIDADDDMIKKQQREDDKPWDKINNNYEDIKEEEQRKEDDENHNNNNVGTSVSEIHPTTLFNNEYYNHDHQIQVGTSQSEVSSSLYYNDNDDDKTMSFSNGSNNNNNNNNNSNSIEISKVPDEILIRHFQVLDKMTKENAKMEAQTDEDLHESRAVEKIEGILDINEPYFDFELTSASSSDKMENNTTGINSSLSHGDQVSNTLLLLLRTNNNDVCSLSATKLKKVVNNNKSKIPVIKR